MIFASNGHIRSDDYQDHETSLQMLVTSRNLASEPRKSRANVLLHLPIVLRLGPLHLPRCEEKTSSLE